MGYKKFLAAFATGLAAIILGAGVATAATSDRVVSGVTNHSVYQAGQTVNVSGVVNGDIYCAGQTVNIDATVNGDVICAGQTVTVNGNVNGNIRVAGQTVNIGAKTDRNVTLMAQNATLQNNARIGGDLTLGAQSVNVDGIVGRDVHGGVQTLTFNGSVGRNVDVQVEKLQLNSGARIGGSLNYTSKEQLSRSALAGVAGTVAYHKTAVHHRSWHASWAARLYFPVAMLTLSMVLVALFPQLFVRFNKTTVGRPWLSLAVGFAAMFVVFGLFIALCITVIGLPLAGMLVAATILSLFLSAPLSAFFLGGLILRNEKRAPLVMLVGGLALAILCLLPWIGGLFGLLASWLGVGSLLVNLKAGYQKPVYVIK